MADPTPEAALALWLADRAAKQGDLVFIARSETRLDRLARACAGFCAGRVELLVLPPWDVLPYDRAAPSADIAGQRVSTLIRLGHAGERARLLLMGADAALQLVPPASAWEGATMTVRVGEELALDAFRLWLGARGYHLGEAVAEAGEVAFRGQVIDLFPAGSDRPVRVAFANGRVSAMHWFDPGSQRSLETLEVVEVFPAVEFPLDSEEAEEALGQEEAAAPLPSGSLVPVFDYLGGFAVAADEEVVTRWGELREQVEDAYQASRKLLRVKADQRGVLPRPGRLYLSPEKAKNLCGELVAPEYAAEAEMAARSVKELMRRVREWKGAVVIATPGDAAALARSLGKRGLEARAAETWDAAVAGGAACCSLMVDAGFKSGGLLILQAAQLVRAAAERARSGAGLLAGDGAPRVGDVVVHEEHGAGRLVGLKPVEADGMAEERVALAYLGGGGESELLVDVAELDRMWRYGSEGSLDRIDGAAWRTKRSEIEREIGATAAKLAAAAAARAMRQAAVIVPESRAYARLTRRFPHALSTDQLAAVEAVLDDLERGRPMDRLVCGDVGFGKTEVALRAAAAVALPSESGPGWQVAVVAPTTVLARQHLETFRRRFAGSGVRVEGMIGGGKQDEVRAGLQDGTVGIVVGTQGLAAPGVRFKRLALVVIDEEQRFGEGQKRSLGGQEGQAVHRLSMTATPIPRTMQMAMVGLRDVSVIATAPARRRATRTLVLPFDPVVVRDALLREQGRGGQSFVVCPRIADLAPIAAVIAEAAPGVRVVQAHGRMKAETLEGAVLGFAQGEGDVLLATNIIEAGLDIPRANTMVVIHPDRFGLAQLHQIRGRVGRGGRRGTAYLLTEPGRRLARATTARLKALETLGSLGAGVAISAADMDQRGAGDLFGEAQAGHVSALGTEFYQHLLLRAVRERQGENGVQVTPVLRVGLSGRIDDDYVPEVDLRISLYRRLARLSAVDEVEAFAEELADRFGALPQRLEALLALARLRCMAAEAGACLVEAGPLGAALTMHEGVDAKRLAARIGAAERDGRVVVGVAEKDAWARVRRLTEALKAA